MRLKHLAEGDIHRRRRHDGSIVMVSLPLTLADDAAAHFE